MRSRRFASPPPASRRDGLQLLVSLVLFRSFGVLLGAVDKGLIPRHKNLRCHRSKQRPAAFLRALRRFDKERVHIAGQVTRLHACSVVELEKFEADAERRWRVLPGDTAPRDGPRVDAQAFGGCFLSKPSHCYSYYRRTSR